MTHAFRVSEACTLALHTAVLLAEEPDRPMTTHEIAAAFNASEAHLSKVLQRLHKAGLVESVRGPRGGFLLAKSPDALTLLDVYEIIEGPLDSHNCLFALETCEAKRCIMGNVLKKTNEKVRKYLAGTSLADLQGTFTKLVYGGGAHA